jgi:phenylalanyl-tRNA synthetase beta chain
MQFSEYWLREFVDPPMSSDELGHLLTMAGLEVEEQVPVAPPFEKIVVGLIVAAEKHPNADKLKICSVDAGAGDLLQIVCGAPNAAVGMKVPCALVGARLPGFEIKQAKLRGVDSYGMLCSAKELGVSDDQGGLLALDAAAPVGESVREVLQLDDTAFTIKLTPNRADCLSLLGVAREVAAVSGAALTLPSVHPAAVTVDACRDIVLDAPAACPRYCGRILQNVNGAAPTPEWMKQRLVRSGIRSISALVDITNFVMLELGQPLHAFDDRKLTGAIHVRLPRPGEQVLLLNGSTVEPDAQTLLIADEAHALALAGIMGGEDSGVTDDTTDLFLESAFFAPDAIAGRARAYGFSSDASHRFERGVDFELPPLAIERATQLVLEICGGEAGPVVEALSREHLPARAPVRLRPERVRRLLGLSLTDEEIALLLESVHLGVTRGAEEQWVNPPSYRFDVEIEEDLIEEIARLHGYDNIPAPAPVGKLAMLPSSEAARTSWDVRRFLADRDYFEVINFAFIEGGWEHDLAGNDNPIKLANPIASQMSVMRSSLLGGLLANLATNRRRQIPRVRIFEIGRCFIANPAANPVPGYEQPLRLAALIAGPSVAEQWGVPTRNADFFDLKSDLEALFAPAVLTFQKTAHPALHPGRAAEILLAGQRVGVIGELHPVWVQKYEAGVAPIVFEVELDAALRAAAPVYQPVSRMPAVVRDLALVVPEGVAAGAMLAALRSASGPLVRELELFDQYHGKGIEPGKKSLAFRVLMQDTQRTLEDSEVDAAIAALVHRAEQAFDAQLRK